MAQTVCGREGQVQLRWMGSCVVPFRSGLALLPVCKDFAWPLPIFPSAHGCAPPKTPGPWTPPGRTSHIPHDFSSSCFGCPLFSACRIRPCSSACLPRHLEPLSGLRPSPWTPSPNPHGLRFRSLAFLPPHHPSESRLQPLFKSRRPVFGVGRSDALAPGGHLSNRCSV